MTTTNDTSHASDPTRPVGAARRLDLEGPCPLCGAVATIKRDGGMWRMARHRKPAAGWARGPLCDRPEAPASTVRRSIEAARAAAASTVLRLDELRGEYRRSRALATPRTREERETADRILSDCLAQCDRDERTQRAAMVAAERALARLDAGEGTAGGARGGVGCAGKPVTP